MKRIAFLLLLLPLPCAAASAQNALPLRDGVYTPGRCSGNREVEISNPIDNIRIFDGGKSIGPSDTQGFAGGFCDITRLQVKSGVATGVARCMEGAGADNFMGNYNFSFQLIGDKQFITDGITYRLCIPY